MVARDRTASLQRDIMDSLHRLESLPDLLQDLPDQLAKHKVLYQPAYRKPARDCQIRYTGMKEQRIAARKTRNRRMRKTSGNTMVITVCLLILVLGNPLLKILDYTVSCFVRFCVDKLFA